MKCGILIVAAIQACAPAPISTRSVRPLTRSGTNTISDSPPTKRKSRTGLRIDAGVDGCRVSTAALRMVLNKVAARNGASRVAQCRLPSRRLAVSGGASFDGSTSVITRAPPLAMGPNSFCDAVGSRYRTATTLVAAILRSDSMPACRSFPMYTESGDDAVEPLEWTLGAVIKNCGRRLWMAWKRSPCRAFELRISSRVRRFRSGDDTRRGADVALAHAVNVTNAASATRIL